MHVSSIDESKIAEVVRAAVGKQQWETACTGGQPRVGAVSYNANGFYLTRGYVSHFCKYFASAGLDDGFKALVAARCGGTWTAPRVAKMPDADQAWRTSCPFCQQQEPESLTHILLFCRSWRKERRSFLWPVLEAARVLSPSVSDRVTLLLGGEVDGEGLAGWAGEESPLYVSVLRFLQAIAGRRKYTLFCSNGSQQSPSPAGYDSPIRSGEG
jgi:hypothetical protein